MPFRPAPIDPTEDIQTNIRGGRAGRHGTHVRRISLALLLPLAATLIAGLSLLIQGSVGAESGRGDTENLRLSSPSPGQLVINWDVPVETPTDYRVSWTPSGQDFLSYKDDNTSQRGNAYPTTNSHQVSGLPRECGNPLPGFGSLRTLDFGLRWSEGGTGLICNCPASLRHYHENPRIVFPAFSGIHLPWADTYKGRDWLVASLDP